jgi:chaperonin cofactor prefoldin
MKRLIFLHLLTILLAAAFALGVETSSAKTSAKAAARPAVDNSVARKAAQQRVCNGFKLVKTKIHQIEVSLANVAKACDELETVAARIKKEELTPYSEMKTVRQKTAKPGGELITAEKTRPFGQLDSQLRGVKSKLSQVQGTLRIQVGNLKKSLRSLDQDIKHLTGLKPAPGPASTLSCVSQETKTTNNQLATLGTRASRLQARINDVRTALDQEFGQGECGRDCSKNDCGSCCAWRFKVSAGAPENSPEARQRKLCELRCTAKCQFEDFDDKCNDLYGMMSDLMKAVNEMQTSVIRNLGS